MSYSILNISTQEQVFEIYNQMNTLYSDQDHFPYSVIEFVAKKYPGLIQIAKNELDIQVGHIFFIPLNERGYENMINPNHRENDLSTLDVFNDEEDSKMYLFVYSIYSESAKLTKKLIASTIEVAKKYNSQVDPSSMVFTEVVTRRGELLAKRMSLTKYHSYEFDNDTLHLYRTKLSDYIQSFSAHS
ncbi:hypothetical protein BMS_0853 [Halobacteriovorax marinus SJ]|uniref:Uncharacterized protein n=1 Tax=Halobacteriovorax marinus (strain ATCC BAA-682 / DSM 15412 / SJ) TaxID=862908 RepID=E1WX45_HALMS|nr:hypothetical protein [Halobacteriovorax marinus]CBW25746.1 hypothetical protein BMS_0853 [Halobacteriovorax marinus SJ]